MRQRLGRPSEKVKAAAAGIDALVRQYDSPTARALLAAALIEMGWSASLACGVTGAKGSYTHYARHLTSQEAELVGSGAAKLYTFNGNGRSANGNGAKI